jgi:hypothetical protein
MPKTLADDAAALSPEDFEEIEEAVMETARGRWFLAEYAKRLRHADSEAMLAAMTKLQAAIVTNQDEILQRLTRALETAAEPASRPSGPAQTLSEREMKFFHSDEELFEPAASAPGGKAQPVIRRLSGMAEIAALPPSPEALPSAMPPGPASAGEAAAREQPKRRIVIIRHKPGEEIDVPLQEELAQTG